MPNAARSAITRPDATASSPPLSDVEAASASDFVIFRTFLPARFLTFIADTRICRVKG